MIDINAVRAAQSNALGAYCLMVPLIQRLHEKNILDGDDLSHIFTYALGVVDLQRSVTGPDPVIDEVMASILDLAKRYGYKANA